MKELFFERRGIYYRFNDFKPGQPTLVFIHGLGGSSSAWFLLERKWAEIYNLLFLDLRGHGRSEKRRHYRDYNLAELAEDTDELLQHLHISDFILVSHSFGTLVALEYLMKYAHKASAVVFLSPNCGVHRSLRARLSRPFLIAGNRFLHLFPFRAKEGMQLDYRNYIGTGDWNLRRMYADIRGTTLRVYLFCLEHTYKFNRDSWWGKVRIPTLIIHGMRDSVIPVQNTVRIAEDMRNKTLVLLPDANHILPLNDADEIAPRIEEFVEEVGQKSVHLEHSEAVLS